MIAKLKGLLDTKGDGFVIIDVNGVGYLVHCSRATVDKLPNVGENCTVLVETIVREDAFQLYGFIDATEKDWFQLLTTVQGVGSRVALSLLSLGHPDNLSQAIASADKSFVSQADGVGPKLAARIVNELKEKVGQINIDITSTYTTGGVNENQKLKDAVSALINLGYRRQEVQVLLDKLNAQDPDLTTEALIRSSLSQLYKA